MAIPAGDQRTVYCGRGSLGHTIPGSNHPGAAGVCITAVLSDRNRMERSVGWGELCRNVKHITARVRGDRSGERLTGRAARYNSRSACSAARIVAFQALVDHDGSRICLDSGAAQIAAELYRPRIRTGTGVNTFRRCCSAMGHALDRHTRVRVAQFDVSVPVIGRVDRTICCVSFHMANAAIVIGNCATSGAYMARCQREAGFDRNTLRYAGSTGKSLGCGGSRLCYVMAINTAQTPRCGVAKRIVKTSHRLRQGYIGRRLPVRQVTEPASCGIRLSSRRVFPG